MLQSSLNPRIEEASAVLRYQQLKVSLFVAIPQFIQVRHSRRYAAPCQG
jgi:hypothetical protein